MRTTIRWITWFTSPIPGLVLAGLVLLIGFAAMGGSDKDAVPTAAITHSGGAWCESAQAVPVPSYPMQYDGCRWVRADGLRADDQLDAAATFRTTTLLVDQTSTLTGNVGIGLAASGSYPLYVQAGASGAVASSTASTLTLESSGLGNYISILGGSSHDKGILFNNPTAIADGAILYDSPSAPSMTRGLQFRTGGNVTNMSIDSTGAVALYHGALDMGSHKITSLTNGSSAQDGAAFGQIASAINTAINGTTNTLPKFTGSHTVGNSSVTDDGTTVVTTEDISQQKGGAGATNWTLTTRTTPSTYPVPTFQPNTANTVFALDLMPKEAPTVGAGGYAWEDVCDADLIANASVATHCTRMAINGAAVFDSFSLNGASQYSMTFDIAGTVVQTIAAAVITMAQPLAINALNNPLTITASQNAHSDATITNANGGNAAFADWSATNDGANGLIRIIAIGTGRTTNGGFVQDSGVLEAGVDMSGGLSIMADNASGSVRFYAGGFAAANLVETMTPKGHMVTGGSAAPSLGAGCTSGTGSAIVGTDNDFEITTGTTSTACTVTFANTWTSKPMCSIYGAGGIASPTCTVSATAITCTVNLSTADYTIRCRGQSGAT